MIVNKNPIFIELLDGIFLKEISNNNVQTQL